MGIGRSRIGRSTFAHGVLARSMFARRTFARAILARAILALRLGGGPCILALACGCASRAAAPPSTAVPTEDPLLQLRRDNAALRRRVQMLEDRVLHLEGGGRPPGAIAPSGGQARVQGEHTLADGRALPIVRLSPEGRGTSLGVAPGPSYGSDALEPLPDGDLEPTADEGLAPEPTGQAARSFRLEGSRLVDLTTKAGPAAPDRPSRSGRGKAIIVEYEAAMAIYESGQVERAEAAFAAFARAYPKHDYADNALYWKGEAAYDQHHYADALAAFTEVVERYGGGNKAPDALLKIGLCYRQLGDLPNARDVLAKLVAAYPRERASDIARVKLAELES